jgi:hypothetical protein
MAFSLFIMLVHVRKFPLIIYIHLLFQQNMYTVLNTSLQGKAPLQLLVCNGENTRRMIVTMISRNT